MFFRFLMFLETLFQKTWFKVVMLFLILFVVAGPGMLHILRVGRQPVQTARVTVVSKEILLLNAGIRNGRKPYYHITFKFDYSPAKTFNVRSQKTYDDLQEGDTGLLSYKQVNDGLVPKDNGFVDFEKDEQ